jgi:hypothetical protein
MKESLPGSRNFPREPITAQISSKGLKTGAAQ